MLTCTCSCTCSCTRSHTLVSTCMQHTPLASRLKGGLGLLGQMRPARLQNHGLAPLPAGLWARGRQESSFGPEDQKHLGLHHRSPAFLPLTLHILQRGSKTPRSRERALGSPEEGAVRGGRSPGSGFRPRARGVARRGWTALTPWGCRKGLSVPGLRIDPGTPPRAEPAAPLMPRVSPLHPCSLLRKRGPPGPGLGTEFQLCFLNQSWGGLPLPSTGQPPSCLPWTAPSYLP